MRRYYLALLAIISSSFAYSQDNTINDINWHRMPTTTTNYGCGADEAYSQLKNSKLKAKPIVLAIISTGVDTTSSSIKHSLLRYGDKQYKPLKNNISNNITKGDKSNTFIGWNLLGTKDNSFNVTTAGIEAFRVLQTYYNKYKDTPLEDYNSMGNDTKLEFSRYKYAERKTKIASYMNFAKILTQTHQSIIFLDSIIISQKGKHNILLNELNTLDFSSIDEKYATILDIAAGECTKGAMKGMNTWTEVFENSKKEYELSQSRLATISDIKTNPRYKLGDDLSDFNDDNYGNRDIMGENYNSGTALTSLIVANSNKNGIAGFFRECKIINIKAIPEGDAFDKDIYNSIIYAVDCGAKIVVVAQSKDISLSDDKMASAFEYSRNNDVLIVLCGGDEGQKIISKTAIFPTALDNNSVRFNNTIRVGGIAQNGSVAKMSNYGKEVIDIFAPSHNVAAIYQSDEAGFMGGTSIAATITAGVAAMLRSYYPKMSAQDIKAVIMKSVTPMPQYRKNLKDTTEFTNTEDLSLSGGTLNASKAVNMLINRR